MIKKSISKKINFSLFIIFIMLLISEGVLARMSKELFELPKTVGVWTQADSVQLIDSTNIFDYMNGAGELYLGYCFNHLEVFEYTAENQPKITVEIYRMKTSDDAFGLLSVDWGGEPVYYDQSAASKIDCTIAPSSNALYGRGLLRIWSDNNYCRILASRETTESREAVITLGGAIDAKGMYPDQPRLLKVLPQLADSGWILQNNRISYFRSHLTLNSLFYISHQNILNLDHSTEAVTAQYEKMTNTEKPERVQVLFVKYAESKQAQKALKHFYQAYLPEQMRKFTVNSKIKNSNFFELEDGWFSYKLYDKSIAIVFTCPDLEAARIIIDHIQFSKINRE